MLPKVAIVILNWNGKDDTLECLASVFKLDYPNFAVIVVDNGSTDGSVAAIRQAYPQVTLIETGRNLGYAGGNNVGIRYALDQNAEFIFLLNNDTIIASDALTHLAKAAQIHSEVAVLGPVICQMEYPNIIWTAGEFLGKELTCSHYLQGEDETTLNNQACYEVDGIIGAAFFARSSIFLKIGLLDERYFLVHEESDWCFRARAQGYKCFIVPQAKIWHKVAASFGSEVSPLRIYFSTRNRLLFAEKNLPKSVWLKLCLQSLKKLLPKFTLSKKYGKPLLKTIYWSFLEKNPHRKAVISGILDYYLRRFGDCPENIRVLNKEWLAERGTSRL
jgi:hypothetical protein